MKRVDAYRNVLRASIRGAVIILLVTLLGFAVGLYVEARIGSPVVSFEFTPFAVWFFGTPAGMLVASAGAVSGAWWRGLAIGLLVHGLLFGYLAWMCSPWSYPFAVNCWVFVVGTIGGGAAGAVGGAIR
jgi:hypothetical protein